MAFNRRGKFDMSKLALLLFSFVPFSAVAKPDIHILFLGRTDIRQSSLINIFHNHVTGKSYEMRDYVVPPCVDGRSCQKAEVAEYIAESNDYVVHLWDAAGFDGMLDEATELSNMHKIETAITGHRFHAIAMVFGMHDLGDDSLVSGTVFNVQHVFPEIPANNIIGIFTRAPILSKKAKENLRDWLSRVMRVPHDHARPDIYVIDGDSFFNTDDDEDIEAMRAMWAKDRSVIDKLVADAAAKIPVSQILQTQLP